MKKEIVYTCSTAWECEAGFTDITVYPSVSALLAARKCAASGECGIEKVELRRVGTLTVKEVNNACRNENKTGKDKEVSQK